MTASTIISVFGYILAVVFLILGIKAAVQKSSTGMIVGYFVAFAVFLVIGIVAHVYSIPREYEPIGDEDY